MSHPLYISKLEALQSFITNNYKDYLEHDIDGTSLDVASMFNDFDKELRVTIGDLYYLQYEEI